MDYVGEAGWPQLTKAEQEHWLGIYRTYMIAMKDAGVLIDSKGLVQTFSAKTVRIRGDQAEVQDGPYADTKEQLGGFHVIEAPISTPRSPGRSDRRPPCMGPSRCDRFDPGRS